MRRWLVTAALAVALPASGDDKPAMASANCHDNARTAVTDAIALSNLEISEAGRPATMRLAGLVDEEWRGDERALSEWLREAVLHAAPVSGGKPDRYGMRPVFLYRDNDAVSLQEWAIAQGHARLSHTDLPPRCFDALFALEKAAIAAGHGLWADRRHAPLAGNDPASMTDLVDRYQVVDGKIISTGRTARRLYLNFGEYWAEDFTVEIAPRAEAALLKAGKRPDDWVGATVRVRGWLSESRGPMIRIDGPNQIERLSDE